MSPGQYIPSRQGWHSVEELDSTVKAEYSFQNVWVGMKSPAGQFSLGIMHAVLPEGAYEYSMSVHGVHAVMPLRGAMVEIAHA